MKAENNDKDISTWTQIKDQVYGEKGTERRDNLSSSTLGWSYRRTMPAGNPECLCIPSLRPFVLSQRPIDPSLRVPILETKKKIGMTL